jgi:hypothetical protein
MCNTLNQEYSTIPEEGVGWKMFDISGNRLSGIVYLPSFYVKDSYGWVNWIKTSGDDDKKSGFCFFLERAEALRGLELWKTGIHNHQYVLRKIEYRRGLGVNAEEKMIDQEIINVALARSFRLLNRKGRIGL